MNQKTNRPLSPKRFLAIITMVALSFLLVSAAPMEAYADRFQEQIDAIEREAAGYRQRAAELKSQAVNLQTAVDGLQAQQNVIEAEIRLNQAKLEQLIADIDANQKKLEKQQEVLSTTLANLYVDGDTSPIEILASSGTLGDFIDQQEYRSNVREGVKRSIKQVQTLRKQLDQQKIDVERTLADQNSRNAALVAKKQEQAELLAQTRGEEAAYQAIVASKEGEVSNLRAQQAAANRSRLGGHVVAGDPGRGGYPAYLYGAPQDSLVDPWGMYNRECVSYTAWKVYQTKGYMPYWGGRGNANQWPSSAQADGIATGSTPRVHSVAISMSGYYGHAMWVESVNGDNVTVSQMNYGINGEYSEMTISASGLIFIYF